MPRVYQEKPILIYARSGYNINHKNSKEMVQASSYWYDTSRTGTDNPE